MRYDYKRPPRNRSGGQLAVVLEQPPLEWPSCVGKVARLTSPTTPPSVLCPTYCLALSGVCGVCVCVCVCVSVCVCVCVCAVCVCCVCVCV